MRAIADNVPGLVAYVDEERRFRFVNESFRRWFELDPAAMIGRTMTEIFGEDLVRPAEPRVTAALAGERNHVEGEYKIFGQTRFLDVTYVPHCGADGATRGFYITVNDITEHARARQAEERARAVAEEASRAKSQFLANMSHEVRTPLHGIIGVTGILLQTALDATQRPLAETVHGSAQALLAVVNRVLDFSRLEAGKLRLEMADFSPWEILREVVRVHAALAEAKGVALVAEAVNGLPERVHGDAGQLRQVLHNLVGNALKFSPSGTVRVEVAAAADQPADKARVRLAFAVRDEGIGIAAEAQARIFEAFAQADDSMARRFGGTGLGLAIARELVALMGGEITVESAPAAGATFRFTAEFAESAPAALEGGGVAAAACAPAHPLRVLIAEDSEVNRLVAMHQLSHLECALTVVEDGRAAVGALAAQDFDLVLMDGQMPEMDGYAATAEIRRREAGTGRRTRVVALTANALEGERERCLAAGMDEYLAKPFQAAQLETIVRVVGCLTRLAGEEMPLAPGVLETLRAEGGPALCARLIDIFAQEAPATLAALHAAARGRDWVAAHDAAHKLRGAAANFGAARLQAACAMIEAVCRTREARFIAWLLPALEEECAAVRGALAKSG